MISICPTTNVICVMEKEYMPLLAELEIGLDAGSINMPLSVNSNQAH
jgi:hypothetical protein